MGGERHFKRFVETLPPEFFTRTLRPNNLLELVERNPEGATAYAQTLRELGGGRYFRRLVEQGMRAESLDRVLEPRHLLELIERSPEGALAYLEILRELGGGGQFERFVEHDLGPEFFGSLFQPRYRFERAERRISELYAWLACTRLFESRGFNKLMADAISEGLRHPGTKRLLSLLPIRSLADINWLSEQTKSPQLRSLVAELTAQEPHE